MTGTQLEKKIVFIGRTTVGKTSIVQCAISGERARDETRPTVAANFVTKDHTFNGVTAVLQIWDTAGQEKYRSMTPLYFRGASVAVLVFSVIDAISFSEIKAWHTSVTEVVPFVSVILVGNKCDCKEARIITTEQADDTARDIHACYCETSAKEGTGIQDLFDLIVSELANQNSEVKKTGENREILGQSENGDCC
jgi:small GTP-binding protein